jgi:hypothetical protein
MSVIATAEFETRDSRGRSTEVQEALAKPTRRHVYYS